MNAAANLEGYVQPDGCGSDNELTLDNSAHKVQEHPSPVTIPSSQTVTYPRVFAALPVVAAHHQNQFYDVIVQYGKFRRTLPKTFI